MACKTYKIGVFFDGTGNNKDFDKAYDKEDKVQRDQQSNVAKLYKLYKTGDFECDKGKCMVTADSHYENGIGTYDSPKEHHKHSIQRKYDKGGGGGGGARIKSAIKKVTNLLDGHEFGEKKTQYKTRLIDVFGFSRGAAEARDFVNTFYEDIQPKENYSDVKFNFIGIYDTVASFGEPGNEVDMKAKYPELFSEADIGTGGSSENFYIEEHDTNRMRTHKELFASKEEAEKRATKLNEYEGLSAIVTPSYASMPYQGQAPSGYEVIARIKESNAYEDYNFNLCGQSAHKIVHMTAHGEVRKNFPLTNIQGSGGVETRMLGVHSDVGGGYAPSKDELHKFSYRGHWRGVHAAAEKEALSLHGQWSVDSAVCARNGIGSFVLKKKVLNDLANVTLNLMYEEAVKHKVTFEPLPNNENHAILPHIEAYYAYAKAHLKSAYKYEQTQDGQYLDATQRHHSSADPAGISTHYVGNTKFFKDVWGHDSADGGGNDARYVDRQGNEVDGRLHPERADHVERAIFHNISTEAVKPT